MKKAPLHLFNKIYLDHMSAIDSTLLGALIYQGVNRNDPGINGVWLGDDLNDALGETSFADKMAELAALDRKYVIFVDDSTFAEIAATWIKSVTNMDADAYSKWVDIYCYKRKRRKDTHADSLSTIMKAAWADATQHDLSSLDVSYSLEWMLPSVWANLNHDCRPVLKSLINDFVKRMYEEALIEAKEMADQNILKQSMQAVLGGSGKDITNFYELPLMEVFTHDFFNEVGNNTPGVNAKINLSGTTEAEQAALKNFYNTLYQSERDAVLTNPTLVDPVIWDHWIYMSSVAGSGLTDEEFNSVLDTIKNSVFSIPYVPFDLEETVCFEFISWMQDKAVSNDTTTLTKYSLR